MRSAIGYLIMVILFVSSPATAAVVSVNASGGGDALTITEGLALASAGDVIEIAAGTYTESVLVDKSVQFVGLGGPGSVVVDGSAVQGLFGIYGAYDVTFRGLTLENGWVSDAGGAIDMRFGPSVLIEDCVFVNNQAGYDGGAIHARTAGTVVTVRRCHFEGNTAAHNGGAGNVILDGTLVIDQCTFRDNSSVGLAGALASDTGADLQITGSLFHRNSGRVGALLVRASVGAVEGNTFHGNNGPLGSVDCAEAAGTTFDRNIISGNETGPGLGIEYMPIAHDCNLFWDNLAGPVTGGVLSPGEVVSDPFYCDLPGEDFGLGHISLATAANSPCGQLIGAFPASCDTPVPAVEITFSQLKGRF